MRSASCRVLEAGTFGRHGPSIQTPAWFMFQARLAPVIPSRPILISCPRQRISARLDAANSIWVSAAEAVAPVGAQPAQQHPDALGRAWLLDWIPRRLAAVALRRLPRSARDSWFMRSMGRRCCLKPLLHRSAARLQKRADLEQAWVVAPDAAKVRLLRPRRPRSARKAAATSWLPGTL